MDRDLPGDRLPLLVRSLRDDVQALQIKVGILEAILLKTEDERQEYARLLHQEMEALERERRSGGLEGEPTLNRKPD